MPSEYMSAEERCRRDAGFASLVHALEHYIHALHLTPTEVREAAMLASIRFEMRQSWTFIYDGKFLREAGAIGTGRVDGDGRTD